MKNVALFALALFALPLFLVLPRTTLKDWDSLDELQKFLAEDDTDWAFYPDANGVINFNPSESRDCDDFAFRLRDRAERIGKRLETESLTPYEMYQYAEYLPQDWQPVTPNSAHLLNKARIGNEVYYIEPQNDKIWLGYYLDNPAGQRPAPIQRNRPPVEPEPEESLVIR